MDEKILAYKVNVCAVEDVENPQPRFNIHGTFLGYREQWQPWTGEFKVSDGFDLSRVEAHMQERFGKTRYDNFYFGVWVKQRRQGEKLKYKWKFLKILDVIGAEKYGKCYSSVQVAA